MESRGALEKRRPDSGGLKKGYMLLERVNIADLSLMKGLLVWNSSASLC